MARNTKILITGINGFIGANLESYIKRKYPFWQIYGIDNKLRVSRLRFNLDLTKSDGKLKSLLSRIKPRYIFHLAGIVSNSDFRQLLELNVLTTYYLFSAVCQIHGYSPRVLIPSSASEYGLLAARQLPAKEDYLPKPVNIYGFSKMAQTQISLMFARNGLDVVFARIFNILGKGIGTNLAIGRFAKELKAIAFGKQKPVLFTKGLGTKRDFLDIQDICGGMLAVILHGKSGGIYNVCRGKSFLMRDLLAQLVKISGVHGVKIIEDKTGSQKEIIDSYGSPAKLRKIYPGFKPVSIERCLEHTYF